MSFKTDKPAHVFDVECYRNFFLVLFKNLATGDLTRVQISPSTRLDRELLEHKLWSSLLIGFNCSSYDLPMIQLALGGFSPVDLKAASDDIILRGMNFIEFAKKYSLPRIPWNYIDLIQVAPLKASLKAYGGRLHCRKLQDLPIDPEAIINADQARIIATYCENDLATTATLYHELSAQIKLREDLSEKYGKDLRSRSDAQVAERIIAAEITKIKGSYPQVPTGLAGRSYKYKIPHYVQYELPQLRALLEVIRNADFTVGYSGSIELPSTLAGMDLRINSSVYRIGIGGLHSSETTVAHVASDDFLLIDRDVTSYYPMIILNQKLYPEHLGTAFLTVYQGIVDRRVAAKKAGDKVTAESLKIAVNGSFGKFGNQYSVLYSPDLVIQVTITGQLSLLMLIERLEAEGITVVSANTDGVVSKVPRHLEARYGEIIAAWEKATGFGTEETRYRAIYSKDVNNYIAIKTDGKVKGKGLYANPWEVEGANVFKLQKNPASTIVIEAVIALLRDNVPVEKTITACTDVRKFVCVRSVTGGAMQKGEYIGKVVRWYYSIDSNDAVINYKKSHNKVPKSDGAKPLMELPEAFPPDINYEWYIDEAKRTLLNVGYKFDYPLSPVGQGSLFAEAA